MYFSCSDNPAERLGYQKGERDIEKHKYVMEFQCQIITIFMLSLPISLGK